MFPNKFGIVPVRTLFAESDQDGNQVEKTNPRETQNELSRNVLSFSVHQELTETK